jgi:archaeosine-15-forming tRNA-guanine transglycosylase
MKNFAYHDLDGNIHGVVIVEGSNKSFATLRAKNGVLITEVEGLNVTSAAIDVDAFRKAIKNKKVATTPRRAKLVGKG